MISKAILFVFHYQFIKKNGKPYNTFGEVLQIKKLAVTLSSIHSLDKMF